MKKRVYKTFSFLFLVSLLVACGGRPKGVVSEKKMVDLLVDMELTEAYMNTQGSVSNEERIEMGRRVMEAHGVSEEEVDTTLAWYGRNMDDYSKLFDKVDAEINRKKAKYTEVEGLKKQEADNLWPYSQHLVISPLSGQQSFVFSLSDIDVKNGSKFTFSFYLPNPVSLKGILGVEYSDGYGESSVSNLSSRKKIEMTLQSDTAKKIERLYGILELKELTKNPIYLDSLELRVLPLDSVEYKSKRRVQKTFGALRERPKPVIAIEKDSVILDTTVNVTDSLATSLKDEERIKQEKDHATAGTKTSVKQVTQSSTQKHKEAAPTKQQQTIQSRKTIGNSKKNR